MDLNRITRGSVLAAITECDRDGREAFLRRHEFKEAKTYYLIFRQTAFDSKAIAGVAYENVTGEHTTSHSFSGGLQVADRLRALGFQVTGNLDWEWGELVIACALLFRDGPPTRTLRAHEPAVIAVSERLRHLNPDAALSPTFRSASSVQQKLENLRTSLPDYAGIPTRGGKLTAAVASAFAADPVGMLAVADRLDENLESLRDVDFVGDSEALENESFADLEGTELARAMEGRAVRRMVTVRERNPKLRKAKIAQSRSARGSIACEVCGFDFEKFYGSLGEGYVQVHHKVPLHFSAEVESTLDHLILLCANCHAMIHKGPGWQTPEGLCAVVAQHSSMSVEPIGAA